MDNDLLKSNETLLELTKKLLNKIKTLQKENEELKNKLNSTNTLSESQKEEIIQVLKESEELLQG